MSEQLQLNKMTQSPIPKLITSLAIPTIIGMLVTSIYNIADTFFVSKLGTSSAGAVGIVFSLMAIIQSIGFTLGTGSGSWISRLLGEKDNKKANEMASTGFFASIILGFMLTIFGTIYIEEFMMLLGASKTILPYAVDYARFILIGAPIMCSSFVLNNILRSEGKAKFAMCGIAFGGVLNIILDPIFIFKLEMGVLGASLATLISQIVSFIILLSSVLKGATNSKIHVKYISKNILVYKNIFKTGLPSLCRQGLASVATTIFNIFAAGYGDSAVAALSIVSKVFMFILSIIIGFGQGFQPVVGYNYGAKRYDRVKESCFFTYKVCTILMISLALIGFIFAPEIISLFIKDDKTVIEIGSSCLRAQCIVMPLIPINVVCNMTFQMIGKSWTSTFLSSTRQGLFFIPILFILNSAMGLKGLEYTQALADIATAILCIPFAKKFLSELNEKMKESEISNNLVNI